MTSLESTSDLGRTESSETRDVANTTLDWEYAPQLAKNGIQRLVLVPLSGPKLTLWPGQKLTVGRATPSDLCIPGDFLMSRHHLSIECHSQFAVLNDEHSTNGTFLNGNAVKQANLSDRDRIVAGKSTFCIRVIAARLP